MLAKKAAAARRGNDEAMSVEEELLKATGVRASKDRQATLEKVCQAVNELSDDDWSALSPEAQQWYTKAAKAYQTNSN